VFPICRYALLIECNLSSILVYFSVPFIFLSFSLLSDIYNFFPFSFLFCSSCTSKSSLKDTLLCRQPLIYPSTQAHSWIQQAEVHHAAKFSLMKGSNSPRCHSEFIVSAVQPTHTPFFFLFLLPEILLLLFFR